VQGAEFAARFALHAMNATKEFNMNVAAKFAAGGAAQRDT
jgi:hypothetical protein